MRYLENVVSLKVDFERCTGCRLCTQVCPHAVFAMEDKKAVVVDRDACIECGACAGNCAFGAIAVEAGTGCAVAIINGLLYGEESCDCSGGRAESDDDSGGCCGTGSDTGRSADRGTDSGTDSSADDGRCC